jgi:hypothetical protein
VRLSQGKEETDISLYSQGVKHDKEYLLEQWDLERNAPLTPENAADTNTARIWRKCEKGYTWQTQLL